LTAAVCPLNWIGEMLGFSIVDEIGLLSSPIMLTGTNHVGMVYQWTLQYLLEHKAGEISLPSLKPLVAACDDSYLDGSQGLAITRDDVYAALETALSGPVAEGCVGAGTGMRLFGFKGGIGTSSRVVKVAEAEYIVGILILTNFGTRDELHIEGVPVGRMQNEKETETVGNDSYIVVLATNAPLHPQQCKRLAGKVVLGLARSGFTAGEANGELLVTFATGNLIQSEVVPEISVRILIEGSSSSGPSPLDSLFIGAIEATEEAIYNALVASVTTAGINGHVLQAISHERLKAVIQR
jgi:D-aminopeptidase